MENGKLILKFRDQSEEYIFENKFYISQDSKLTKDLFKTNIKNQESSLIIKSMNDLPISDVIQFKINLEDTGSFLVNFSNELTEEIRVEIIEKIKKLKDNLNPTPQSQTRKIEKLLGILNEYKPIYVVFSNLGEIRIPLESLANVKVKFPVIANQDSKKRSREKKLNISRYELSLGKAKKTKNVVNNGRFQPKGRKFKLLSLDYIFILVFSLFASFGAFVGVYKIFTSDDAYIFLLALAFIFIGINYYAVYSSLYKKGKEKYKGLRYYLILFVTLGLILGLGIGYIVSKFVIKDEISNSNFLNTLIYSGAGSLVLLELSIPASRLINRVVKTNK